MTLSWDNGAGLTFQIGLSIDDNYMFTVRQTVKKRHRPTGRSCFPGRGSAATTSREVAGYYVLFEGLLGVVDGTLQETTYDKAKIRGREEGRHRLRGDLHRRLGGHHRQILADRADPGPESRRPR